MREKLLFLAMCFGISVYAGGCISCCKYEDPRTEVTKYDDTWACYGRLEVIFQKNAIKQDEICASAVIIGANYILTAAHALYNPEFEGNNKYAKSAKFFPCHGLKFNEELLNFAPIDAAEFFILKAYERKADFENKHNCDMDIHTHDIAIIKTNTNKLESFGSIGLFTPELMSKHDINNKTCTAAGYPNRANNEKIAGEFLYKMDGEALIRNNGIINFLYYKIFISKGQSGGAVIYDVNGKKDYRVISVNSQSPEEKKKKKEEVVAAKKQKKEEEEEQDFKCCKCLYDAWGPLLTINEIWKFIQSRNNQTYDDKIQTRWKANISNSASLQPASAAAAATTSSGHRSTISSNDFSAALLESSAHAHHQDTEMLVISTSANTRIHRRPDNPFAMSSSAAAAASSDHLNNNRSNKK